APLTLHPGHDVVGPRAVQWPSARSEDTEKIADVATICVERVAGGVALGAESGEKPVERALGVHIGDASRRTARSRSFAPSLAPAQTLLLSAARARVGAPLGPVRARRLVRAIQAALLIELLLLLHAVAVVLVGDRLVVTHRRAGRRRFVALQAARRRLVALEAARRGVVGFHASRH